MNFLPNEDSYYLIIFKYWFAYKFKFYKFLLKINSLLTFKSSNVAL